MPHVQNESALTGRALMHKRLLQSRLRLYPILSLVSGFSGYADYVHYQIPPVLQIGAQRTFHAATVQGFLAEQPWTYPLPLGYVSNSRCNCKPLCNL